MTPRGLTLDLDAPNGAAVTLQGEVNSFDSPWIAVGIPDGDLSQKRELIGALSSPGER